MALRTTDKQKALATLYVLLSQSEGDFITKSYVKAKIQACLQTDDPRILLGPRAQKKYDEFLKSIYMYL